MTDLSDMIGSDNCELIIIFEELAALNLTNPTTVNVKLRTRNNVITLRRRGKSFFVVLILEVLKSTAVFSRFSCLTSRKCSLVTGMQI